MQKILKPFIVPAINVITVVLTFLIWVQTFISVWEITHDPEQVMPIIGIVVVGIGVLAFIFIDSFRKWGLAITAITATLISVGTIMINNEVYEEGDYVTVKVIEDSYYMNFNNYSFQIIYKGTYPTISVSADKFLRVDSIDIRIDRGLFGFELFRPEIMIVESDICSDVLANNDLHSINHANLASELMRIRCFDRAVHHYSKAIALDSLNANLYNSRACAYLIQGNYKKAFYDFYTCINNLQGLNEYDHRILRKVSSEMVENRDDFTRLDYLDMKGDIESLILEYEVYILLERVKICKPFL